MKKLTGAQIVIESLIAEGVDVIFGYPGGAILPTYDALLDSKIKHVLVRHEQGATHMAEGYARVSGRPGVVMVTSGPGATNTVTGIADAYMDSTPMVVHLGPGSDHDDRQRRFPGSRFRRHHAPLHQAQLPGQGRQGHRAHHQGSILYRGQRTSRSGRRRSAQRCAAGRARFQLSRQSRAARLQADHSAAIRARSSARSRRSKKATSRCSTSAAACNGRARRPSCATGARDWASRSPKP